MPSPQVLGHYEGNLYVILPDNAPPSVIESMRELPPTRDVLSGDPNLPELAGRIYGAVHADRQLGLTGQGYRLGQNGPRSAMVGWRCIAVWSLQGGTGRSTIATALALEAAERRLPTLLVGLGVPDVIPLRLNFDGPEPNLLTWSAVPTPEQLKVSVRQFDVLDVLAGFPDQSALDAYVPVALSVQQGLPALSNAAAHAGYAVVILDVSSPEMAAPAISAANTLFLTALPTPDGLLAVGEASRMAGDYMSRQHSIPLDGMHLVLNRVRDTMLAPDEFMRSPQPHACQYAAPGRRHPRRPPYRHRPHPVPPRLQLLRAPASGDEAHRRHPLRPTTRPGGGATGSARPSLQGVADWTAADQTLNRSDPTYGSISH